MSKAAFVALQDKLIAIRASLTKFDKLELDGAISSGDAEMAYKGGLLDAVTSLEDFLEASFNHILDGGTDYGVAAKSLVQFDNDEVRARSGVSW